MIFSLPNVCESERSVVRGFVAQFQAGEDSRSAEEGVDQESGPRVRTDTRFHQSGYGLTTRGVRHYEEGWQGRYTSRNAPASEIASSEDKSVRGFSPLDITVEIGDADSFSRRVGFPSLQ